MPSVGGLSKAWTRAARILFSIYQGTGRRGASRSKTEQLEGGATTVHNMNNAIHKADREGSSVRGWPEESIERDIVDDDEIESDQ